MNMRPKFMSLRRNSLIERESPTAEALEPRTMLAADLSASLAYTSGTYYPGMSIAAARLTELNVGGDAADGYSSRIVLSTDRTYGNEDDVELESLTRSGSPLAGGGVEHSDRTLTIPGTAVNGRYYVIVRSDSGDAVTENSEANNTWISAAANVVVERAVVSVTATDRAAAEAGLNTGRFRFARTGPTTEPLVVNFTVGGTATSGSDYQTIGGTVTIEAGAAFKLVLLRPINDTAIEGPESVSVTVTDEPTRYTRGTASARVDIADNDGPKIRVNVLDASAAENSQDQAKVSISRTGNTDDPLEVTISIGGTARFADGDFQEIETTVTIEAGETSAAVIIVPLDDNIGENSETVIVTAQPGSGYTLVQSRRSGRITIADNEPVVKLQVTDGTAAEGLAGAAGEGKFTVTRVGGDTSMELTVAYSLLPAGTAGAADFASLDGTVIIPANMATAVITVSPVDDALAEPNETVVLELTGGSGYRVDAARKRGAVTIGDNEPTVSLVVTDAAATESNTTTGSFVVRRTGATAAELTVAYTVSGTAIANSDYVALSGTVTIPAGQLTSAPVPITPIDDSVGEGAETVIVTLANSTAFRRMSGKTTGRINISDNEPVISITASDAAAGEGITTTTTGSTTQTGEFTISRAGGANQPAMDVPITISGTATLTTDFTTDVTSTSIVTIPANATLVKITIIPAQDSIAEPSETVVVTIGSGAGYLLSTSRISATVTIADDEPVVSVTANRAGASEATPAGETGTTTTGQFTFTRTNSSGVGEALTVLYTVATGTATNGTDYTTLTGTIEIPVDELTATLTVTPIDDAIGEGLETVILTISESTAYTRLSTRQTATVNISDNEAKVSIVATDAVGTETDETEAVFKVQRTGSTTADLTVYYTVDGTAETGDDFEPLEGAIIIPAGQDFEYFYLYPIDDLEGEGVETVVITVETDSDAPEGVAYFVDSTRRSATATITDNEPVVSVVATDAAAGENNNPGVFTFSRTGSTEGDLVILFTIDGTAEAADYEEILTSVTIPDGASNKTVTVRPIYDNLVEVAETVRVTLSAGTGFRLDNSRKVATVNIANAQPVDLAIDSFSYQPGTFSLASTGVQIPLVATITNSGAANAALFTYQVRLSLDTTWGNDDDVVIGGASISALAAGQSLVSNLLLNFDSFKGNLGAGSYYILSRVDDRATVLERTEANNTFTGLSAEFVITA